MKFSLFIHMERFNTNRNYQEALAGLVELVQIAEEGGFNTVWIGEHHGMEFTISPNPLNYLSYLTPITNKIRLGAGTLIAPFWHPLRLAGESAMVDVMSGGRVELGIARGAYQFEFDRMLSGVPAKEGGEYMREMVPVVQKLWSGDYAHDGKYYSFPTSTSIPKPVQDDSQLPVWIAAREQESHEFAVRNGCNVMVTPLAKGDSEVLSLVGKFNSSVKKCQTAKKPKLMVLQHLHMTETDEETEAAAKAIQYWYATFSGWFKNDKAPVDGFVNAVSVDEISSVPGFDLESLKRNLMIGNAERITERLRYYESLGVDEYSYWIDNSMSHERKKASLESFIEQVSSKF